MWLRGTQTVPVVSPTPRRWPRLVGLAVFSTVWVSFVFLAGLASSEGSAGTAPGLYVLLGIGFLGATGMAYAGVRRSGASRGRSGSIALATGVMSYVVAFVTATAALWAIVAFS